MAENFMRMNELPLRVGQEIGNHHPVQIYGEQGQVEAVILAADAYYPRKRQALDDLNSLRKKIGQRTIDMTKEKIMELLDIDAQEYENFGLGHY